MYKKLVVYFIVNEEDEDYIREQIAEFVNVTQFGNEATEIGFAGIETVEPTQADIRLMEPEDSSE